MDATPRRPPFGTAFILFVLCGLVAGGRAEAAHAPTVTGTWTGTLVIDGAPRSLALQLHRRSDGEVYGYALGGSSGLTVSAGASAGSRLLLDLAFHDPGTVRTVRVDGTIAGARLTAVATTGAVRQRVRWTRRDAPRPLSE